MKFALLQLLILAGFTSAGTADEVSALAILEQNCLSCHNAYDAKGDVVLDRAPVQIDDLKAIVNAISGPDPDMPKERDPLSTSEIASLTQWVEAGAPIPEGRVLQDTYVPGRDWWSLEPLRKTRSAEPGTRNPVDGFVEAKLAETGLTMNPPAEARTLIRRASFDLTGLPPTREEIAEFEKQYRRDSESAFRDLVDRLLASPAYGEHWARHWLDVARYGESHGYDKDKPRPNAWPYRDYVIRSFNEDKPWSRFIQEQIAGDLLFPDDPDGVVALGFIAAGPWDFIAHYEVGEQKLDGRIAKHMDRDDMVSATFNAFMSTTVQCAQCHHHKFDPVSMEDYYRLHAVFAAVDRAPRVYGIDPEIQRERERLSAEIEELETELKEEFPDEVKKLPEFGYHSQIEKSPNTVKWVQIELPAETEVRKVELIGAHDDFAGIGAGFGFPLRYKLETADDAAFTQNVKVLVDRTTENQPNPGVVPVTFDVQTGARFLRLTATRLAERKNDYILALAELRAFDAEGKNVARDAKVTARDSIEAPVRWRKTNLVDGKFPTGGNPDKTGEKSALTKKIADLSQKLSELPEGQLVYAAATHFDRFGKVIPTEGEPRTIHLLHRGDMRSPGAEMQPGAPALWNGVTPKFDLPPDASEGQRRAALARYLTDPKNPLTWRSIANRVWLYHMGRGIVDSPNDFGRMGMEPTHPELLDFLAATLRDDPKQSLKNLHRLIITSKTWGQSSAYDPAAAKIDATNAYYWRANRRRLSAEEIRDAVLFSAGKLDREMGGPSFKDFVIEKPQHSPHYQYHLHDPNDPESHRRSIYRMIVRSKTQPFMTTLDCADPSQMVAKRDETTTALQALALMNNPFMTTMAGHFAERVEGENDPVATAFEIATGRKANESELAKLSTYAKTHGLANTCRIIFNLNEFAYVD